jgi:hypothetical protein
MERCHPPPTVHLLEAIKVSLILNFMSVGTNSKHFSTLNEMSVHQLPVLNFLVQGWVISYSWGPERPRVRELEEMTVVPKFQTRYSLRRTERPKVRP